MSRRLADLNSVAMAGPGDRGIEPPELDDDEIDEADTATEVEALNARLQAERALRAELLAALKSIVAACDRAPWFAVAKNSPQMDAARIIMAQAEAAR